LEAAIDGENPEVFFSLELYGWDGANFQPINTYQAVTTGLTSSFVLLELELSATIEWGLKYKRDRLQSLFTLSGLMSLAV
jgi:hypothetical protein